MSSGHGGPWGATVHRVRGDSPLPTHPLGLHLHSASKYPLPPYLSLPTPPPHPTPHLVKEVEVILLGAQQHQVPVLPGLCLQLGQLDRVGGEGGGGLGQEELDLGVEMRGGIQGRCVCVCVS